LISRTSIAALVLTAALLLFLLLFGQQYHVIESVGSEEYDGYPDKAEQIRSGTLPRDPYRPLLYPAVSAGIGALLNDTFAGSRVTSSLFACLLLLMAYLIGRLLFGEKAGLFVVAALALNYNVLTIGMNTTTDMMFSGLALCVIYVSLRANEGLNAGNVILLALFFALAYFTRYTAAFLIPAVLMSLMYVSSSASRKKVVYMLLLCIGATALFLVPHFYITTKIFGSPFYNENWKNLAFKLYGGWDWTYFQRCPYNGLLQVLLSSPSAFIISSVLEIAKFFYSTLLYLGGGGIAGALFAAAFLAGLYNELCVSDRRKIIVIAFLFIYVILSCSFFYSSPRFMLLILPLCYMFCGKFLLSDVFAGSFHLKGIRIGRRIPVITVFLIVLGLSSARHMNWYIDTHPVKELEAAIKLEETFGSGITVLGTFPFFKRYVEYDYIELEDAFGEEQTSDSLYFRKVRRIAEEKNADYVIIGRLSLGSRPKALLFMNNVPSFLTPIYYDNDAVVYRVEKESLPRGQTDDRR
jgi:hypothetical protein